MFKLFFLTKRIIATVALVMAGLSFLAEASAVGDEFSFGIYKYRVLSDSTAGISGFDHYTSPDDTPKNLILDIPEKTYCNGKTFAVTEICDSAFLTDEELYRYIYPDTGDYGHIQGYAASITIPSSINYIGSDFFYGRAAYATSIHFQKRETPLYVSNDAFRLRYLLYSSGIQYQYMRGNFVFDNMLSIPFYEPLQKQYVGYRTYYEYGTFHSGNTVAPYYYVTVYPFDYDNDSINRIPSYLPNENSDKPFTNVTDLISSRTNTGGLKELMFYQRPHFRHLQIPHNIKFRLEDIKSSNIYGYGFYHNSIAIGKDVTKIEVEHILFPLNSCPESIYFFCSTPPEITDNFFASYPTWHSFDKQLKIHVPPGCKDAYKEFMRTQLKFDLSEAFFERYLFDDAVPVDSISVVKYRELEVGDSIRLNVVTHPETSYPIYLYQSTNMGVAKVEMGGMVYAVSPGEADIICTFMEHQDTCHVVVKGQREDRITLNASIKKVPRGSTVNLRPVSANGATDFVVGVDHLDVVEASLDDGVVTVRGLKLGDADVTVWPADGEGKSASCRIMVIEPVNNDVNNDGEVNAADVSGIYRIVLGIEEDNGRADINLDGVVNTSDVSALYQFMLNNQ